ncbi:MAG: hypothetical protein AB7L71_02565 [Vicinamibacterales bacterium]
MVAEDGTPPEPGIGTVHVPLEKVEAENELPVKIRVESHCSALEVDDEVELDVFAGK